jgi:predicted lipid-binding transport protein (Tim44 family)
MHNRCLSLAFIIGLLAASGMAGASAAMAQSAAPQQQAAISDADLKTFAGAAKEVQQINQTYVPAYQAAQTEEQRKAIEQEAMTKMADAVKEKGLTVDKYNQIVQAAQADPEVARQIDSYARQGQ